MKAIVIKNKFFAPLLFLLLAVAVANAQVIYAPPVPPAAPSGMGDGLGGDEPAARRDESHQNPAPPTPARPALRPDKAALERVRKARPVLIGRFSLLNKVTGKIETIFLRNGEPVVFRDMTVTMFDCLSNPPEEVPDTRSFLQIFETRDGADSALFSGWMFASSPSIHALDHPVYDLWPLGCTTETGDTYVGKR